MKVNHSCILIFLLLMACENRQSESNELNAILTEIIDHEFSDTKMNAETTSIFFLQNAECKCAESTLELIHDMSVSKHQKVVVVVNNKDHFSLPQLAKSDVQLRYLSVNDLISYGFFQAEDLLVKVENDKISHIKL